eukprot:COSAG01_NODE_272_length_19747_cov_298.524023_21_plen_91_part_00
MMMTMVMMVMMVHVPRAGPGRLLCAGDLGGTGRLPMIHRLVRGLQALRALVAKHVAATSATLAARAIRSAEPADVDLEAENEELQDEVNR